MAERVIGVFASRRAAERAADALGAGIVPRRDVAVIEGAADGPPVPDGTTADAPALDDTAWAGLAPAGGALVVVTRADDDAAEAARAVVLRHGGEPVDERGAPS
jgi:hypothetical protein